MNNIELTERMIGTHQKIADLFYLGFHDLLNQTHIVLLNKIQKKAITLEGNRFIRNVIIEDIHVHFREKGTNDFLLIHLALAVPSLYRKRMFLIVQINDMEFSRMDIQILHDALYDVHIYIMNQDKLRGIVNV